MEKSFRSKEHIEILAILFMIDLLIVEYGFKFWSLTIKDCQE
jgi:hypothetical protein